LSPAITRENPHLSGLTTRIFRRTRRVRAWSAGYLGLVDQELGAGALLAVVGGRVTVPVTTPAYPHDLSSAQSGIPGSTMPRKG
jgi:hypothetical protein